MASLIPSNAIPLPQISIAFGSVGASYVLVGTFASPVEIMYFASTFDKIVQISFDGVHDHLVVNTIATTPVPQEINFKANRMVLPAGSVFIKQISSAPGSGNLYISAFTAKIP